MRKTGPTDIPVAPLSRDCASEGAQKREKSPHRAPPAGPIPRRRRSFSDSGLGAGPRPRPRPVKSPKKMIAALSRWVVPRDKGFVSADQPRKHADYRHSPIAEEPS